MIRNPVHLTLALLAVLGLVALPAASNLEAQGSKGTIKIATQSPLSGGQAALGEGIKLGAQLAVEKFKGNLEKMGYKVALVPYDDQAKPDVGVANAKNIIADKDILAVIGHLNSGVAIPSSEVYKEVSLVMISPANTNPVVTDRGYLNVNRVCGRDDVQGVVGSEFARGTMKTKSVYIIHDKTQYGQGVAEFFKADAEKKGIKVLGFEGTEEKSNFDPIVTPIKAKNPDVIYFGGIYDQAAPFFKQTREKGVKSKFLGPDGMDSSDLTKIAGKAVVGMYYTSAAGPASALPKAKTFVEDFKKKFGKNPEPYAAEAYDATAIALKAIEAAAKSGKMSREDVATAVRKTKHNGITGDIEFDAKGDRKKALYFVLQVASDDPAKWGDNKIVKQLAIAARPGPRPGRRHGRQRVARRHRRAGRVPSVTSRAPADPAHLGDRHLVLPPGPDPALRIALAERLQPRLSDDRRAERPLRADPDARRLGQVTRRHRGRVADAVGAPRDRQPHEDRDRDPRGGRGSGGGEPHGHQRQPDHLAHVLDRRGDGGCRGCLVRRPVRADQPLHRVHSRAEGVHRRRARRHRQYSGCDGRRPRARPARGLRGLLSVAADGRRVRRRVQGHLRLLDAHRDPHLPTQGPAGRDRPRPRVGPYSVLAVLPNLGYVAFFAVGAYTWSIFVSPPANVIFGGGFPLSGAWFFASLSVGHFVAAVAGILLGLPVLRLHGDSLAIVTLGFGEVIRVLANNLDKPINLTNGPKGITPISRPPAPLGLPYGEYFYFLVLLIVVLVVLVNRRLENSHIGRAWEAIREDELAARAMGVPLVRMTLLAFACGASFAGVMGVLFSAKQVFINPESFTFLESIGVLAMVILGGMGSIPGAVVGATVVTVLNLQVLKGFSLWLNELKNAGVTVLGYSLADLPTQFEPAKYERMVFGVILVLMMIFRPQGIFPARRRQRELGG